MSITRFQHVAVAFTGAILVASLFISAAVPPHRPAGHRRPCGGAGPADRLIRLQPSLSRSI